MKFRGAIAPLAVVLGLAALGSAAPAFAAAPETSSISISAAPDDSGDLTSGEDLTLQVSVENNSDHPLSAGKAVATVGGTRFSTRSALANWFSGSGSNALASRSIGSTVTAIVLAGETQFFTITVPAASVSLGAAGVYPVNVTVTSGTVSIGASRTAVAWNASSSNPVPVALAAPLTVPTTGADTTFLSAKTLATDTAPTGILTQELTELTGTRVAIGIDPRIIASIRVLGKSAPQTAIDWLQSLAALPNDTFPLAWADADLTVGLQAGLATVPTTESLEYAINPSLFGPSSTPSTSHPGPTPTPTSTTAPTIPPLPTSASLVAWKYTFPKLGWPAENSVTSDDLPKLSASGTTSVILSSTNISRSGSHTPGGASAAIGKVGVAVSDETLSTYLRAAVQSTTHGAWLGAMTKLTTAIEQVSIETPRGAPIMLATLGRNWVNQSLELPHTINDLYSRVWVTPSTLAAVVKATPTTAKIVNKPEAAPRVSQVAAMFAAEARTTRFSAIAQSPIALTSNRRLVLLSVLSNEWAPNSSAWDKASAQFIADSNKIVDSVQVVQSSDVLFATNQGSLPITVNNELDQPVTVYITVRPQTTQLFVDKKNASVQLTLNADEQRKAAIPVQSVSNGKVRVAVSLTSANGIQIGSTKTVSVNVQAGWETLGTLIFAALVVATFGFGITRNILKRRRARSE